MKTEKKIKLSVALLAVIISLGIGIFIYLSSTPVSLVYNLQPGMTYLYRLEYQSQNETSLPMQVDDSQAGTNHFTASIDIEATIGFKVYDKTDDLYRLGVYFEDFKKRDLGMMGQALFASDEEFNQSIMGQEAVIEMTPLGEISKLLFDRETHPLFKNLTQSLMGEIQVLLNGDSREWDTQESNTHGTSHNAYAVSSVDFRRVSIDKKRVKYAHLNAIQGAPDKDTTQSHGDYSITFHKKGYLDSLTGKETIAVTQNSKQNLLQVDTNLSLALIGIENFKQTGDIEDRISRMEKRRIDEIVISEKAKREALKQQAAGLTVDQIVKDILSFGNATSTPFGARWLWRASGSLKLNPQECWKLTKIFDQPQIHNRGKNLILELLSAAGHDEAQAVMVFLLSRKTTAANEEYFKMFQRLSVLEQPNSKTAQFVHQQFKKNLAEMTPMHLTTTYTLAAVAKSAHQSGNDELAKQYAREITNLLENSENPRLTYHYLITLGTMELEENVDTIAPYAKSDNAKLREVAAYALKDTNTSQTRQIVSDLLGDADREVQARALQVLKEYDVNADTFQKLDELVSSNKMKSDNYDILMNLLVKKMKSNPDQAEQVQKTLARLLEKDLSPRLRYKLRKMVGNS